MRPFRRGEFGVLVLLHRLCHAPTYNQNYAGTEAGKFQEGIVGIRIETKKAQRDRPDWRQSV